MPNKVLVIEDEPRIAHWVRTYFEKAGFDALIANTGKIGLDMAHTEKPDLIILDIMLPEMDGTEVCRRLRKVSNVPIIMLTAKGSELDRILGLEIGADDYVVKPFSPDELMARSRAVLRRVNDEVQEQEVFRVGGIELDTAAHVCNIDDQPIELSKTQFAMLALLMQNAGRVLSRQQLLEDIFQGSYTGFERTVDVHIRRLRKKIESDPADPKYIRTVYGIGYKFSRE